MKTSPRVRALKVGQSHANSRCIRSEGPALSSSRLPIADSVGRGFRWICRVAPCPVSTPFRFPVRPRLASSPPSSTVALPPALRASGRPKRQSIHARLSVTSKHAKCSGIDLSDHVSHSSFPPSTVAPPRAIGVESEPNATIPLPDLCISHMSVSESWSYGTGDGRFSPGPACHTRTRGPPVCLSVSKKTQRPSRPRCDPACWRLTSMRG